MTHLISLRSFNDSFIFRLKNLTVFSWHITFNQKHYWDLKTVIDNVKSSWLTKRNSVSFEKANKNFFFYFKGCREEKHECWKVIFYYLLLIVPNSCYLKLIFSNISLKFKNLFSNHRILFSLHSWSKYPSTIYYLYLLCSQREKN